MTEEIIANAGQKPGREIWRVEAFELGVVDPKMHGNFYRGDAYIILNTKQDKKSSKLSWDIHFWLGDECSQDESGSAAILTAQIDEAVANGAMVQYREVMDHETSLFNGYFEPGAIYLNGGFASGFQTVIPNDYSEIQRLLWVRGKKPVRCSQCPMSWDSINRSDCFILDIGNDIYVLCGEMANPWEKLKANDMANRIRDDERAGRAKVVMLDGGDIRDPSKLCEYLGDEMPEEIPDEAPEAPPKKKGKQNSGEGKLYKISDENEDGNVEYELLSDQPPYKMKMLEDDACYILGAPAGPSGYIWKGKNSAPEVRKKAIEYADKYIEKNDLPKHTEIQVMAQYGESPMFKQFFSDWRDLDETEGMGETFTVGSVAKVEHEDFDAATMHDNPDLAAEFGMPDDGSGSKVIYKIVDSEREEVDEADWGIFRSTDCYLISYTYETPKGKPESYIYYWLGNSAGTAGETAAAFQTVQLDQEEFGGDATQIRVEEGKEPNHLIAMFGGAMAILSDESGEPHNSLYHIRLNRANQVKAYEVSFSSSNLNSNDTFLVAQEGDGAFGHSDTGYAWYGKGSNEKEKESLRVLADRFGISEIKEIEEEDEDDEFWEILGGKEEYFTLPRTNNKPVPPRAFECSDATGNFIAEEILGVLHQTDLQPTNVFLLDVWESLFIWIGSESRDEEKEQVESLAKEYLETSPSKRKGTPIISVFQGKEPVTFTGFFLGWDDEFWDTDVDTRLNGMFTAED